MIAPHPPETIVKTTTSRCLVCHELCPAQVYTSDREVHMRRLCPTHGTTTAKISSDLRYYWTTDPANPNQCCASDQCCSLTGDAITTLGDNARDGVGNYEKIATCFLLIDIVDSCNLPCPTCYAASPYGPHGEQLRYTRYDEVVSRVESFISRKGAIEVLMLSGGEPTLHPDFLQILDWTVRHPSITGVVVNTNGVQLANDRFYSGFRETYTAFARDGIDHKLEIYLQFDGTQEEGQRELRGYDLRPTRYKVIDRMSRIALRMNLAMTVTDQNLPHVWETVRLASGFPHIRAVCLQPRFQSGRNPSDFGSQLNAADVIGAVVDQSKGVLQAGHFRPLPCSDPNCQIIAPYIRFAGKLWSLWRFVDPANVPGYMRNRMNYSAGDLAKCGCGDNPFAELLMRKLIKPRRPFVIVVKPFMCAETWDEDRIKTCCTHVLRPDGEVDSFCRYYSRLPGTYNGAAQSHATAPFAILS